MSLLEIKALLSGKKTYLAAAGLTLTASYHALSGDYAQASQSALLALGFLGLRAALPDKA